MSERMKILIAHDGSTCADDALNDLPRAGLPRECKIATARRRSQAVIVTIP